MTVPETGPDLLESGLEALGIEPDSRITGLLYAYADELEKWSRSYNLVSVRNRDELIVRHLLDSISVQQWIGSSPLLDIGAGAGLPGIPLAIIHPDT